MKALLVHPFGPPFARHALLALCAASDRCDVATTFAYLPGGRLARMIQSFPTPLRRKLSLELGRRSWLDGFQGSVYSRPLRELCRVSIMRSGLCRMFGLRQQSLADWVAKDVDEHIAALITEHGYSLVYGYEDGAAATFRSAKERGAARLYDLPIMHFAESCRIQREEADRFPELRSALAAAEEPEWKLERKRQELELADRVIVASSVTRCSLERAGYPPERVTVIPYGIEAQEDIPSRGDERTFHVLFVGRVGPRKGVHYLLRAWNELALPHAKLTLVGVNEFPAGWLERNIGRAVYHPAVSRTSLDEFYRTANLLVLPSLVEGFGLVLLEAMSRGIPVLATDHTAAPDLVTEGREGFVVRIRDVSALQEKLLWAYDHRRELCDMGACAAERAKMFSWERYRERLVQTIRSVRP